MNTEHVSASDLARLTTGQVPEDPALLKRLTAGVDLLSGFLRDQYLKDYIPAGGSKLKFLTGRQGSGKTHLSRLLMEDAADAGFLTVSFSAKKVWLHDFREIYLEILNQCGIEHILQGAAASIVRELGTDPADIPQGKRYMDYLSDRGEADAITKSSIREALRDRFTKNPRLDNSFALSCSLLTGSILGHPVLEPANQALLLQYLKGDRTIKLAQLRALGLSPSRITKYNARNMLRSLSELVRMSGYAGIFVVVDDLETLLNRIQEDALRYTRTRREDSYESIRQLIDDIDSMRCLMFVFCFDRELMDNESSGLKSYQALWMRIQNEVSGSRFNCFSDILDLDRLADQVYTPDTLVEMSFKLAEALAENGAPARIIDPDEAEQLIRAAEYGGLGLPCLVNRAVQRKEELHV